MKNWIFVTICLASGIANADNCDATKTYSTDGKYIGCKTSVDGHKNTYGAADITSEGCGTFCSSIAVFKASAAALKDLAAKLPDNKEVYTASQEASKKLICDEGSTLYHTVDHLSGDKADVPNSNFYAKIEKADEQYYETNCKNIDSNNAAGVLNFLSNAENNCLSHCATTATTYKNGAELKADCQKVCRADFQIRFEADNSFTKGYRQEFGQCKGVETPPARVGFIAK